jgi:hypothetical protein
VWLAEKGDRLAEKGDMRGERDEYKLSFVGQIRAVLFVISPSHETYTPSCDITDASDEG